MRPLRALLPAQRDRLDVRGAQYSPAAAASGMAAIVRDRGIENSVLTGRADRCDPIISAEARFQRGFRFPARLAAMFRGGLQAYASLIDDDHRQLSGASDDHNCVAPATLARNRETTAGKRVVD